MIPPTARTSTASAAPGSVIVIGYTDDGLLKIRAACGNRRYTARVIEIDPVLVAREATQRETTLGYPVEPVAPRQEKETQ